jgi:hypothetical protein
MGTLIFYGYGWSKEWDEKANPAQYPRICNERRASKLKRRLVRKEMLGAAAAQELLDQI